MGEGGGACVEGIDEEERGGEEEEDLGTEEKEEEEEDGWMEKGIRGLRRVQHHHLNKKKLKKLVG